MLLIRYSACQLNITHTCSLMLNYLALIRIRVSASVCECTCVYGRGGSRIFERGGLIIKKLYSKSVRGALIKYHFGLSRNDASLCAHKLIQV